MYSDKSTESNIIENIPFNDKIFFIPDFKKKNNEWVEVLTNYNIGWIKRKNIALIDPGESMVKLEPSPEKIIPEHLMQSEYASSFKKLYSGYSFIGEEKDKYGYRICYLNDMGELVSFTPEISGRVINKEYNFFVGSEGRFVYYIPLGYENRDNRIYKCDSLTGDQSILTNQAFHIYDISPDKSYLLFRAENKLKIIDINGNNESTVIELESEAFLKLGKWVNNNEIVYSDSYSLIKKVNIKTGIDEIVYDGDSLGRWGGISLDGKLIFGETPEYRDRLKKTSGYIDIHNKDIVFFEFDKGDCEQYRWSEDGRKLIFSRKNSGNSELVKYDIKTKTQEVISKIDSSWSFGWTNRDNNFLFSNGEILLNLSLIDNTLSNITELTGFEKNTGTACPHLYIDNGSDLIFISEIVGLFTNMKLENIDYTPIDLNYIVDNKINIVIKEELYETTYLNEIYLKIDGKIVYPINCPPELLKTDEDYLILERNQEVELSFEIGAIVPEKIELVSEGFYESAFPLK